MDNKKVTLDELMDVIVDSMQINMETYNNMKRDFENNDIDKWIDEIRETHNHQLINMLANYIAGYEPDIEEYEEDSYFGQGYHDRVYMINCEDNDKTYYNFDCDSVVNSLLNLGHDCTVYFANVWDDFDLEYDKDCLEELEWQYEGSYSA